MRADAYAVSLYDDRRTVEGILFGLCHGVHGVEDVFAVAMDNLQVLEPREVVGNLAVGGLVFFWDGNAMSYHAPYAGHDGIQLAVGQVFKKGEDFLFPYYRDMLTVLSAGINPLEI